MLCYVILCYVMLCYVMLCYVMLCYVMLCYVMLCYVMSKTQGHAVAQLVETLLYKPEGRGFDFRWCHCNFSLT